MERGAWSGEHGAGIMSEFRFEDFTIWQEACDIGDVLCGLADKLGEQHLYGFADQLRRAALSISNNIAEGSGSESNKEFANFLNYARRSVFECANMVIFFERKRHLSAKEKNELLPKLSGLSRMIISFKRSLR